jgi:hypothetical protein
MCFCICCSQTTGAAKGPGEILCHPRGHKLPQGEETTERLEEVFKGKFCLDKINNLSFAKQAVQTPN